MEKLVSSVALVCTLLLMSVCIWSILNWVWFRPRKLEKCLRKQGFKGNSYKFLLGDSTEMMNTIKEATSKPMEFSNQIVSRVVPPFYKAVTVYGRNCFLWFGPTPAVVLLEPDVIKEVMNKNYDFPKPINPVFFRLVRGLATYEGDKWAKHRKLLNPAFHPDKLKQMLPSFYVCCQEMLSKWEKIVMSEGWSEVDVWPDIQTLTSDAISRTAFGSNYEEGRKIFELQTEQAQLVLMANRLAYIPGWRFLPTKTNRKMKEIAKQVESSVLGIINRRIAAMKAGEAVSNDLLGILLDSNFKEMQQNGDKSGMSLQDVIEECKVFYFAGQETTASLLVWTMVLLSKHSDWQTRARDEVMQVFGKEKPDFTMLNHLKIVSMIFHEVLRLYPPFYVIARTTQKDSTVGNIDLPSGVQLILPVVLVHHDRQLWGDDADEFNPERFREGVSKATGNQLIYFPFGWGPRLCIGQNFSLLEAKLALAMILQSYSFEISPSYTHAPHTVLTLQPKHGAHLILHKL